MDLHILAEKMLSRHPRVLEYSPEFFKKAVKSQEGIDLTDEQVLKVARLIYHKKPAIP